MSAAIIPLEASHVNEAAAILEAALAHASSAWHDREAAWAEAETFVDTPDRLALVALDNGQVVGWIGAVCHSEHAWELHPLVVDPAHQARGWGTRLVEALEDVAREAGVCTIWLGTDDDFGGTNLFGVDLYPDVLAKVATLAPTKGHPFTFYRARGFTVTGILPDADGIGRHDIVMAKRVIQSQSG